MLILYIFLHLVPPIIAGIAFVYWKRLSISGKLSICSFLIIYSFVMYGALITDHYLSYKLEQFDLNGDGFFSGDEVTPEQETAMNRVISDTGRTFAPFTGLFSSAVLASILYFASKIIVFAKKHLTIR